MSSFLSSQEDTLRLTVEDLACRRGERLVFSGLSLVVDAGEKLLVLGPNGVGKTSLLRILAGLLAPAAGMVSVMASGQSAEGADLAICSHFVGSRDGIKGAMTCREHVDFWRSTLAQSGEPAVPEADADSTLAEWGLEGRGDVPAAYLSSGQRKRLALARLSCAARPIWLLDEPGNALDTRSLQNLAERIDGFCAAGGIALIATHMPLPVANARVLELGVPA